MTDPLEIVYWYNVAPRANSTSQSSPADEIFRYDWRFLRQEPSIQPTIAVFETGQKVVVKPPAARCTSKWISGTVTGINSPLSINVDGIPRHVADIRIIPNEACQSSNNSVAKPVEDRINLAGM